MKVLPFYTSTGMRDAERVTSWDAILCPTQNLLPFQIQRDHLTASYVTEVKLVDCEGTEIDMYGAFQGDEALVTDWENGPHPTFSFTTFNDGAGNILTAIESSADNSFCYSDAFSLATGESIAVSYNLTLNSGTLPNMKLGIFTGAEDYSSSVLTKAGGDIITLTATGNTSGNVYLMLENLVGNNTSFASAFTYVKRTNLVVTEKTTYDFITYNGEPFAKTITESAIVYSSTLPYGVYYLRLSDGNTTWYSEWFAVEDIQPQLLSGWTNISYDTFTTLDANITSAIHAAGTAFARTNTFSVFTGEKFIFTYDLTLNSGAAPLVRLYDGTNIIADDNVLSVGLNEVEITSTASATAYLLLRTSGATNYSLGSISLRRKWGDYVHIEYTNARDFDNADNSILYVDGFTQQAYLRSYLNLPSHESIEIGEEKNGVFQSEKLVRKYTNSVVSYESRSMYNALSLLKNHSTIKILDEVGVEHIPEVGNVDVNIDWNTFDTGSLRIAWNERGDVWTNSMDNII